MDPHCHDITIGLYRDVAADQAVEFTAFSYSRREGAVERVGFVNQAMKVLGGLKASPDARDRLRFSCGQEHRRAVQRLFMDACKFASSTPLEPRAMDIFDKKSQLTMIATGEGGGRYRVTSDGTGPEAERRIDAVTRGLPAERWRKRRWKSAVSSGSCFSDPGVDRATFHVSGSHEHREPSHGRWDSP